MTSQRKVGSYLVFQSTYVIINKTHLDISEGGVSGVSSHLRGLYEAVAAGEQLLWMTERILENRTGFWFGLEEGYLFVTQSFHRRINHF